ncbi:MAG: S8 family peptidase [Pseudomonadota bacterium]|nr:S8 family peptidase [Pseudomonadota bacterium]
MDVKQWLFGVSLVFYLVGCGPTESRTRFEFHESSAQCQSQVVKNQYLVQKYTGEISVERSLEGLTGVLQAEPNYRITIDNNVLPSAVTENGLWGIENVEAESLWNQNIFGSDVLVAVIDSGVELNHDQIRSRIAVNDKEFKGALGIDDDGNGKIDDAYGWNFASNQADVNDLMGHGTHVAGIILAEHTDDEFFPKGLAPRAKLIPISFIDRSGGGYISDAIFSLDYAKSRGAKVVNASWGGAACSVFLREKIQALASAGILFVSAAGNDGVNVDKFLQFPASFNLENQITVGSIDSNNAMSKFSNFGSLNVHLMAPGADILSTYLGSSNSVMSGTSMSTPFVVGAAALLWSARPTASYLQIKQALLSSVTKVQYPVSSRGRLNLPQALSYLMTH